MSDRLRRLIREIHRRSLWQVLGIYVVASWAVLQVVDTLGGAWNLPDWFPSFAFALLLVGLPIVLATAFVQEGVSGRDRDAADLATSRVAIGTDLLTWRNAVGGGVLALALWGILAAAWVLFGSGRSEQPGRGAIEASVAIMPCDDLSPAEDQAALAQGLAEEVSLALSQLPGMEKVISRHSTVALKSQGADLGTIASALDVANVLNCTVARDGNRVRVTAQLTDANTAGVLWSDGFNEPFTGLFTVYDVIARGVADGLRVMFAGDDQTPIVTQATASAEAHEAYLRGRYLWNQRTADGLRGAIEDFERAVEIDPTYAEAWSGLADSHLLVDQYTLIDDPSAIANHRASYAQALDAAREAVNLAPALGMARTSLGYAFFRVGEWANAQRELERAINLSPGYATAHQWFGDFLSSTGRAAEGITHVQRAFELDPVSRVIARNLGNVLWAAGRREAAIEQDRQATELHPDFAALWSDLSMFLLQVGRYDEGLEAWEMSGRLAAADDMEARSELYEAAIRGRQTGGSQVLSISTASDPVPSRHHALLYAYAGRMDLALRSAEELVRQGAYGMVAFQHVFLGDLLDDDLRYQALLEEAGITW